MRGVAGVVSKRRRRKGKCGRVIGHRAGGQWGGTGVAGQLRGKPGRAARTRVGGAPGPTGGRWSRGRPVDTAGDNLAGDLALAGRSGDGGLDRGPMGIWRLSETHEPAGLDWLVGSGRLLLVGRGGVYIQEPPSSRLTSLPSPPRKPALVFLFAHSVPSILLSPTSHGHCLRHPLVSRLHTPDHAKAHSRPHRAAIHPISTTTAGACRRSRTTTHHPHCS